MKHWKTTLSGLVVAISWLLTNLLLFRDLMGQPKREWAGYTMLVVSLIAVAGILFLAWHSKDKDQA